MDITLERIVSLLKQQKKKQIDLCNSIGISKGAFTSWKNGNNKSYEKHISKIADFFSVSTDYLLGKENSPLPKNSGLSPIQKELIALFDSVPPELQTAVIAVLKFHVSQLQAQDADKATL